MDKIIHHRHQIVGLAPRPVNDPVTPTVDPVAMLLLRLQQQSKAQIPYSLCLHPWSIGSCMLGQKTTENLSDPLTRALYFGTQDQPCFYQQLQQAGAKLIGQDKTSCNKQQD